MLRDLLYVDLSPLECSRCTRQLAFSRKAGLINVASARVRLARIVRDR